jgi:hypothetical protein
MSKQSENKTETKKPEAAKPDAGQPDPRSVTPTLTPEQIAAASTKYPKLGEEPDDTVKPDEMPPEMREEFLAAKAREQAAKDAREKERVLAEAAKETLSEAELAKLNAAPDTDAVIAEANAKLAQQMARATLPKPPENPPAVISSVPNSPALTAAFPPPPPQMTAQNSGAVAARPAEGKPEVVAAPAVRKVRPIYPTRYKLAEHARQHHQIIPETGTKFEDVLAPGYFAHVAGFMRPLDIIEVMPEEMHYFAELLVRAKSDKALDVSPIRYVEFPRLVRNVVANFAIEFRGPVLKNCVVRLRDDFVVQQGFDTPERANNWLALNQRGLAA